MPTPFMRTSAVGGAMQHTSGCMKDVREHEVDDGRDAEEEREAPHRTGGEQVEHAAPSSDTRSAATIVRNERAEAGVERRAHGLARAHLVFQSLEVHDVRVDGDTDRHDDAGDAGEREREAATRREVRHQREEQHAGEAETDAHDQAEQPVVEEHVERDEAEADEAGDDARVELVLAERRRDALHRLLVPVELHRQRAVRKHGARSLRLALAEVTR